MDSVTRTTVSAVNSHLFASICWFDYMVQNCQWDGRLLRVRLIPSCSGLTIKVELYGHQ
jgi:hypothetical protein